MKNDRVQSVYFQIQKSEQIHTSSSETQHSVALLHLD